MINFELFLNDFTIKGIVKDQYNVLCLINFFFFLFFLRISTDVNDQIIPIIICSYKIMYSSFVLICALTHQNLSALKCKVTPPLPKCQICLHTITTEWTNRFILIFMNILKFPLYFFFVFVPFYICLYSFFLLCGSYNICLFFFHMASCFLASLSSIAITEKKKNFSKYL